MDDRFCNTAAESQHSHQGHILWLPAREDAARLLQHRAGLSSAMVYDVSTGHPIREAAYNHPVVVLSRPETAPNTVCFCIITSFHGQPITKALKRRSTQRWNHQAQRTPVMYVPLHTQAVHPERERGNSLYSPLSLAHGLEMQRPCYVNVRDVYQVDWRALERYWGAYEPSSESTWTLNAASVAQLLQVVSMQNGFEASSTQYRPSNALSMTSASGNPGSMSLETSNTGVLSHPLLLASASATAHEDTDLLRFIASGPTIMSSSAKQYAREQSSMIRKTPCGRSERLEGTLLAEASSTPRSDYAVVDYGTLESNRDHNLCEGQMQNRPLGGQVSKVVSCIVVMALCLGYTIYAMCR